MNWTHVLHQLTYDYQHIHGARLLFRAYLRDHAVAFLQSGVTSGSGGRDYLRWLTWHRIAPVDW